MKRTVVVNDTLQGYVYYRTNPSASGAARGV
jgi:hypothetical protein